MVKEHPIFVESYFRILPSCIHQTLYFFYKDPTKNYLKLKNTGALEGEIEFIQANLQHLIDEDDLFINRKKVRMIIRKTSLEFQEENSLFPFLKFNIESEAFQFINKSINEIHLVAKPEKILYPAISSWETLVGKITSVISSSKNIISKDLIQVTFLIAEGEFVGGEEKILIQT
ncbi:MAG: hypothetical protein ACW964_16910 [Candidatus Hodarchaeales archaeon]|jgi:hypothetical protein